jgi:DNA polymerase/3'-5' exonuclease PolX
MPKNPMNRERAIELVGKFMLLEGMDDLDFFVCGSVRRGVEEVGDVDMIVVGNFPNEGHCQKFYESGKEKSRTYNYFGRQINMWSTTPDLLGSAVMYATGSGMFNQRLRQICIRKGMKLSQNGLFERKSGKLIVAATEKQIFNRIGFKYIPPSYREKKQIRSTFNTFKMTSQKDLSYDEPILGRVFNRDRYSILQQNCLPPRYKGVNPALGAFYISLLLGGDPDA